MLKRSIECLLSVFSYHQPFDVQTPPKSGGWLTSQICYFETNYFFCAVCSIFYILWVSVWNLKVSGPFAWRRSQKKNCVRAPEEIWEQKLLSSAAGIWILTMMATNNPASGSCPEWLTYSWCKRLTSARWNSIYCCESGAQFKHLDPGGSIGSRKCSSKCKWVDELNLRANFKSRLSSELIRLTATRVQCNEISTCCSSSCPEFRSASGSRRFFNWKTNTRQMVAAMTRSLSPQIEWKMKPGWTKPWKWGEDQMNRPPPHPLPLRPAGTKWRPNFLLKQFDSFKPEFNLN